MKINEIFAEEILDSRGNPTIQATVVLEDGKEIKRYSGALSYEQLNKLING